MKCIAAFLFINLPVFSVSAYFAAHCLKRHFFGLKDVPVKTSHSRVCEFLDLLQ